MENTFSIHPCSPVTHPTLQDPPTPSKTYSPTHAFQDPLTHPPSHTSQDLLIHPPTHTFQNSPTQSPTPFKTHPRILPQTHPSTH